MRRPARICGKQKRPIEGEFITRSDRLDSHWLFCLDGWRSFIIAQLFYSATRASQTLSMEARGGDLGGLWTNNKVDLADIATLLRVPCGRVCSPMARTSVRRFLSLSLSPSL